MLLEITICKIKELQEHVNIKTELQIPLETLVFFKKEYTVWK